MLITIKEPERKNIEIKNALHFKGVVTSYKDVIHDIKEFLLFNQIYITAPYVYIENEKIDNRVEVELFFPISGTAQDISKAQDIAGDERFSFVESHVFENVVACYYKGSLRMRRYAMRKLGEYLAEHNNLRPTSKVSQRLYHMEDGSNISEELFVSVEEKSPNERRTDKKCSK